MSEAHLHLVPVRSREAKEFVRAWHRHHPPPAGQIFSVGAADETGTLRAVAIVGRPVARHLDDGSTLEVTRTTSDGAPMANSLLYGAAWRAAKALGYRRLITYTQAGESGASLRGAGWRVLAHRPARPGWHTPSRPRTDRGTAHIARTLWQAPLTGHPSSTPTNRPTPQPPAALAEAPSRRGDAHVH
ncbi:XF1762 family protein [Streptomyces sp. SCSIO 30461]|uniref:XF1762 family protein n=1 Tax=Streptomyces sp. SCSIO 30461 TaxID=3118085 RepID=UPI0030D1D7ED